MPKNKFAYICLSCAATGCSWLWCYKVLQDDSVGAVVPIYNLSMVVSIIFSYMIFKKNVRKIKHKYSCNNRRHLFMLLRIKFKIYKFV